MNFGLYGVLALQGYIYHVSFPKDNLKIKCLVYFVLAFETAQIVINGIDTWDLFANRFGDIGILATPGLGAIDTPMMGSITAFVVQIFFCYRIWIINRAAWWFSALVGFVSLVQAVAGFVGGVMAYVSTNTLEARHRQTSLVYLWLVGDAVADVMIASAMSFLLLRSRQKMFRTNDDVIVRIVRMTVETNSLSTAVAIISTILFAALPNKTYFVCPTLFLGKLYANTLLVTFNNRAFISQRLPQNSQSFARGGASNMSFQAGLKFLESDSKGPAGPQVTIMTHSVTDARIGNDVNLTPNWKARDSEWHN